MTDCIAHTAPEPVFAEPWHAQVFAVTVALNEAGRFDWPEWATRFSATLKRHGLKKELDGGEYYFRAWLETLETLLADSGETSAGDIDDVSAAWEKAYLTTPHGSPVELSAD
ncbi:MULTISPECIES: nitrile hydratase accessory protein [unclassified Ruegeria]|uniref:nitrile hydratase accessory protein n=1 Tax=unclassified Ruegeria TaxID=2625375 RepID=UPI0014883A8D|nr:MULTISPECIES: nitrile hydratase accessory protein [unclassified Ruegeria]